MDTVVPTLAPSSEEEEPSDTLALLEPATPSASVDTDQLDSDSHPEADSDSLEPVDSVDSHPQADSDSLQLVEPVDSESLELMDSDFQV